HGEMRGCAAEPDRRCAVRTYAASEAMPSYSKCAPSGKVRQGLADTWLHPGGIGYCARPGGECADRAFAAADSARTARRLNPTPPRSPPLTRNGSAGSWVAVIR